MLILTGTGFLMLPAASVSGMSLSFVNALFTATSAVCVTGLAVVDTGTYFTFFGQMVIIILIQLGGLGIMTFATMISVAIGKKINLRERLLIQETLNQEGFSGVVRLALHVIKYTFLIEFIFGSILAIHLYPIYGAKAFYMGYWHSISAFCNAGFDLFGNYDSLVNFRGDVIVNLSIMSLIILGGLGFIVLEDVLSKRNFKSLMSHSKIVLISTAVLIFAGTVALWLLEHNNIDTIANLSGLDQWMACMFQSVTSRTAGFNTLPIEKLTDSSLLFLIMLMFIGASPTSTGGGIKTTTFVVVLLTVWSLLHEKSDIVIFNRRISKKAVNKAFAIFILALFLILVVTLLISGIDNIPVIQVLFEVVSAFGTVGLSVGITRDLSEISKLLLVLTMYAGRVGVLTFAMLLLQKPRPEKIKYPEVKVIIG
ncbi:Ktr system potassium uptake protein B [bioreactor metagenome]|uniref:Ktr system potassium uptake protein B n=1 Tax=bioreactor metagenome TaxID=1076179 RepID=A0A644Z5V9_9ZZZZ